VFTRHQQPAIEAALADTPATMLVGPRQSGKTTLVRAIAAARGGEASYHSLDERETLDDATDDPVAFVGRLRGLAVIDEIQKAPRLLPAIKVAIDRDRRPGRFLLTGSANVLALPRVSESLAGRMEVATLWPLSQGELLGKREGFIDRVLRGEPPAGQGGDEIVPRLLQGGYPEAATRLDPGRRRAFFEAYLTTITTRDVRDVAAIEDPGALHRLLQLCAARTGATVNHAELGRTLGVPVSTIKRYLALLETLYLVHHLPAWSSNRGKRLARTPKLHVVDTGLAAALIGVEAPALAKERHLLGPLLESFAAAELRKQLGWSEARPNLLHFRSHAGAEVDLVLEDGRGRVVGIEVKATSTPSSSDFKGLKELAETAGKSFVQGILLHLGGELVAFGPTLTACPIDALWA
jgi:predicted AAA+ superfamily ATPase